ncbi:MAG: glycosyltransferase family 2 protein [Pseudomonadota bacterium]|jgi:GT2 family glycosyltransferase
MAPRVSIVTLNWRGVEDTLSCLDSLRELAYPNFFVVVVDNGSGDDSVVRIADGYPDVDLVETGANLGFAGGCNVGIRRALELGTDYVWLLNSDTWVDPRALAALVERAEQDPRLGAVGSVICDQREPQRVLAWGGGWVDLRLGRPSHALAPVACDKLDYLTGASLLLRPRALEEVGLLDERFFLYWEETDLCFRLRARGWKLGVAPDSRVWHRGPGASRRRLRQKDRHFNHSAVQFLFRYAPHPWIATLTGGALRLGVRLARGEFGRARAVVRGLASGLRSRRS